MMQDITNFALTTAFWKLIHIYFVLIVNKQINQRLAESRKRD